MGEAVVTVRLGGTARKTAVWRSRLLMEIAALAVRGRRLQELGESLLLDRGCCHHPFEMDEAAGDMDTTLQAGGHDLLLPAAAQIWVILLLEFAAGKIIDDGPPFSLDVAYCKAHHGR
ncbi:hypothetical protein ACLOJK_006649 [Asimina triloba]